MASLSEPHTRELGGEMSEALVRLCICHVRHFIVVVMKVDHNVSVELVGQAGKQKVPGSMPAGHFFFSLSPVINGMSPVRILLGARGTFPTFFSTLHVIKIVCVTVPPTVTAMLDLIHVIGICSHSGSPHNVLN